MIYLFAPTVSESSLIVSPRLVAGRWFLPEDQNAVVIPSVFFGMNRTCGWAAIWC